MAYEGGYWRGDHFFYNRSVNRIDINIIHDTYNRRIVERNFSRVSYTGGRGGIDARPTRRDEMAARERHINPTREQIQHRDYARGNRAQWASQNHGRPGSAATRRPGQFNGRGVVRANRAGGPYRGYNQAPNRGAHRPNNRYNQPPNRGQQYRPNKRGYNQPPNRNVYRPQNRQGGPGRPNNARPNQNRRKAPPPEKPHGPGGRR